jgi:uncharacterized protein (TIGR02466 family)
MKTVNYALFPTLVTQIENFISTEQANDIKNYILDSNLNLIQHEAIIGNGVSSHADSVNKIFWVIDLISNNVESCKGLSKNLNDAVECYLKTSGIKKCDIEIKNSWANVQNKGSVLDNHTHPRSVISGTLFINADEGSNSLYFYNPNPFLKFTMIDENTDFSYRWYRFKPAIGSLILFPSWLLHGSNQTENKTDNRITVSFNT